jgi:tyrosine-protein phosphatase YwqE
LFFFSKSKPSLQNCIPLEFIDIHSHLLPGIDDGAKNIEETVSLISKMKGIGIKKIITTPHIITNVWDNTENSIISKLSQTLNAIPDTINQENFSCAAEYMLDSYFLKRMATEKLLTLKQDFILVEMSYLYPPLQLYEIIFEIQLAGYKPILAHPERYLFYHNNYKEYDKLKSSGCYFQLNLLSTVNYYGPMVTKIANKLIKDNVYNFVGSDIHHEKHIDSFSRKIAIDDQKLLIQLMEKNSFFTE